MKRKLVQMMIIACMWALPVYLPILSAGDGCCSRCKCKAPCTKVCRLECIERAIEVTCWGCKCEDFCVPCRSCLNCEQCDIACKRCQPCGDPTAEKPPWGCPKKYFWRNWCPTDAEIFSRKRLMKATYIKTVPGFVWVVEDLCESCQQQIHGADIAPGFEASVPKPPIDEGVIIFNGKQAVPASEVSGKKNIQSYFEGMKRK